MTKKELRKIIEEKKNSLPDNYFIEADKVIQEIFLNTEEYKEARVIFAYVNVDKEPETKHIIKQALSDGKTVCVPKCLSKGIMDAYIINSFDDLESGKYGIMEPKTSCEKIEKNLIDTGIIPCISANGKLQRIGHGCGYYDRFMAGTSFVKVCLCYAELSVDDIVMDEYDVKVDMVVTEKGIISEQ